jgi:hypothetical protein
MNNSPILQQALELARLGYRVLPVRPKSKQPAITEWPRRATTDEAAVCGWFQNAHLNLGVVCGDIFVLDFDDAELAAGWPDPARNAELRAAAIAVTRTPRGGAHFWFASPDQVEVRGSVGKIAPKLDVRGAGNFIMCPPSATTDGRYRWERPPMLLSEAPAAPAWLIGMLAEQPRPAPVAAAVNGVTVNGASVNGSANGHVAAAEAGGLIPEGRRKATLVSIAGLLRERGLSLDAIGAALRAENSARCRPPLPESELVDILKSASKWRPGHLPAPQDDGDVCLAEVEEKSVEWMWPDRIPLGFVTVIAGRQGLGKSLVSLDIAARVTTGTPWPDGAGIPPVGGCVIVNLEDDAARVLKPRLRAAGADMARIRAITTPIETFEVERIERIVNRTPECRLLIADPIGNHLGAQTDAFRDNSVRAALSPLSELAKEKNLAVIIVAHLRKTAADTADFQILGSVAFTALARAGWHVLPGEGEGERLFVSGKMNLSRPAPGLRFRIFGNPPRVEWGEALPPWLTADAVLEQKAQKAAEQAAERRRGRPAEERAEAEKFVQALLADGPRLVAEIQAECRAAGISFRTAHRAAKALGIRTEQAGPRRYYWLAPGQAKPEASPASAPAAGLFACREDTENGDVNDHV